MNAQEKILLGELKQFKEFSDKRFDSLENKVDMLLSFRWKIAGAAALASGLCSLVATILFEFVRH